MDRMHGTVGVAPANLEVCSALVPDAHGGNMDSLELRAGTTRLLGVNVEGALFSLGDGQARQGEGETCAVAFECAMDTVVILDQIRGRPTPWPRIESDIHVMSTGSARPWRTPSGSPRPVPCSGWRTSTGSSLASVCDTNDTSDIRQQWPPERPGPLAEVLELLREVGPAYLAGR